MGFDRRFALTLTAWLVACLLALVALALSIATPGFAAVRIVAALLVMGMIAGLLNHIDRTNRTVARFVEALRYGDFSTRFDGRGGVGFDSLGGALDAAMRGLQAQRDRTVEVREHRHAIRRLAGPVQPLRRRVADVAPHAQIPLQALDPHGRLLRLG